MKWVIFVLVAFATHANELWSVEMWATVIANGLVLNMRWDP